MSALRPHDSYEFYLCILDTLHEALAQEVEMKISKEIVNNKDGRLSGALNVWKNEFSKKYSPFVEYSYGLLHFVVECQTCKNETYRWEPMTALKAVVSSGKQGQTLEEMLKDEFLPETIDGYDCEHCSPVRQTAIRKTYIWKLPKYIVVVLKRFTFDGRRINTPLQLASTTFTFNNLFSKVSPEYDANASYNLLSIVDHHGGAQGGHYTAQCKTNDKWHIYDDESSHSIEKPLIGTSTYMLWFG
jgi:ubiquitin C-terminal hydrolase